MCTIQCRSLGNESRSIGASNQMSEQVLPQLFSASHIENDLSMQQQALGAANRAKDIANDEKDVMLEWHQNKPSIWQQYYGSKRLKYANVVKKIKGKFEINSPISYVSMNSVLVFCPLNAFLRLHC